MTKSIYGSTDFQFGKGVYVDNGCPERGGCERSLECPREECILDVPFLDRNRPAFLERNQKIARLRLTMTVKELAVLFGISTRNIHRAVRQVRDGVFA